MDRRLRRKKFNAAKKVITKLLYEWYQSNWIIYFTEIHDEDISFSMTTTMDDAYHTATFEINTTKDDTWRKLVRSARHEAIHLTQVSFVHMFTMLDEAIGDNDIALSFSGTTARNVMERAVVQIEGILDSTAEYSLEALCKNILKIEDSWAEIT